jgi:hypothetical protein
MVVDINAKPLRLPARRFEARQVHRAESDPPLCASELLIAAIPFALPHGINAS